MAQTQLMFAEEGALFTLTRWQDRMSSAVNHLVLYSPTPPNHIPAPEDPANQCTAGQRSHVRPLKSFMRPYQTYRGGKGQRNPVFYGLLGIACFHLKAIKGLPSMETLTAWGWDMVHLGSGWRKKLNSFSSQPCDVCGSPVRDPCVLMTCCHHGCDHSRSSRQENSTVKASSIYRDYCTHLRLACGSG